MDRNRSNKTNKTNVTDGGAVGLVARSHHGATLQCGSARGCWQVVGAGFFRVFSWGICYEMVKFWGCVEIFLLKGCKFWDYNITLPKIEQIESRTAKLA